MTLMELQKVLGEQITAVKDGVGDIENAKTISSLAKQMINNADIVLRADKLMGNKGERIDAMVGR